MYYAVQDWLFPIVVLAAFLFVVSIIPITRVVYFKSLPSLINKAFRKVDNYINDRNSFEQVGWFNSAGHSRTISIVVFIVLLFTLFGPTLYPLVGWLSPENLSSVQIAWGAGTWLLFFILLTAIGYFSKRCSGNSLRWVHAAVIFVAAVYILFLVPESYYEASGLPYRHAVAGISAALLVVGLVPARFIRFVSFRDFSSDNDEALYRRALARCLLENLRFTDSEHEGQDDVSDEDGNHVGDGPSVTWSRGIHSLVVVPFREPVLLLLFPALTIIIPVFHQFSELKAFTILIISWLILASGMYFSEWNAMVKLIHRRFARGGSFAISLLVILIGICDLLNISYIRTFIDSDTWLLPLYVVAGYFIVWLYDYWANRILCTEILRLFRGTDDRDDWRLRFRRTNDDRDWILQLHGRSRFMIIPDKGSERPMQEALTVREFMQFLASNTRGPDKNPARILAKEVVRVNNNHLICVHALFATLLIITFAIFYNEPREPLVTGVNGIMDIVPDKDIEQPKTGCENPEDEERLACRLFRAGENGPVVLLAASGGGTRAALYTASVLNGLHSLNQLDQLVLASGVSGGGVALAYLAGNYTALAKADPIESCDLERSNEGGPWAEFCRAMAAPYIHDVIRGMAELRIVMGQPSGRLLAESFKRRFGPGGDLTLGEISAGPALILNTTLAGHPRDASEALYQQFCPGDEQGLQDPTKRQESCKGPDAQYTVHAGGRLVFTNLRGPVRYFSSPSDSFPSAWFDKAPDAHLKYIVINDASVPLTSAAALTANFPPVFSNAGVNIIKGKPDEGIYPGIYWVTDGGVADNRGVISLLYALRIAVYEMKHSGIPIPKIHVIVAEASAGGIDYTPSRGLSVIMGSSAPFASQLMIELVSDIEEVIETELTMHYLTVPRMLVSRGGVGTHWMIPENVMLVDPAHEDIRSLEEPDSVALDKNEIVKLMFSIHDSQQCVESNSKQYLDILGKSVPDPMESNTHDEDKQPRSRDEWVCSDIHQKQWARILTAFQHEAFQVVGR